MIVKCADFITSMKDYGDFATKGCPEVAFAGKSNVGKSSMINKLTNRAGQDAAHQRLSDQQ